MWDESGPDTVEWATVGGVIVAVGAALFVTIPRGPSPTRCYPRSRTFVKPSGRIRHNPWDGGRVDRAAEYSGIKKLPRLAEPDGDGGAARGAGHPFRQQIFW